MRVVHRRFPTILVIAEAGIVVESVRLRGVTIIARRSKILTFANYSGDWP